MKKKNHISFISLITILIIQAFIPKIYLGFELYAMPDIILIYIVYLSFVYKRYYVIALGFILGLFQDIISQSNLVGLFAFNKTIASYILGSIGLYDKIWNNQIKTFFIFCAFFIHFFIVYYMMYDRLLTPLIHIFKYSFLQSFISIVLVLVVNRFILIDNKIIK
tara:strand:+ start:591 stop:1082 length:492 start_codon:yes stop_codon:yes gene_type:complete